MANEPAARDLEVGEPFDDAKAARLVPTTADPGVPCLEPRDGPAGGAFDRIHMAASKSSNRIVSGFDFVRIAGLKGGRSDTQHRPVSFFYIIDI